MYLLHEACYQKNKVPNNASYGFLHPMTPIRIVTGQNPTKMLIVPPQFGHTYILPMGLKKRKGQAKDLIKHGDESVFGGGKSIRDGMNMGINCTRSTNCIFSSNNFSVR